MKDWWKQGELDYRNRAYVPPAMERREAYNAYVGGWMYARDLEFGYYGARYEGE